jgi:hypothetical protein
MEIKYKIINFDGLSGSVQVLYYTDDFPDGLIFNVDIPIVDGNYVSKEELLNLIELMKPKGQLERVSILPSISTPDYVSDLVEPLPQQENTFNFPTIVNLENLELQLGRELTFEERLAWEEYNYLIEQIPNQPGYPTDVVLPVAPDDLNR